MLRLAPLRRAPYTCRACGAQVTSPASYIRCPVCGIKWG